MVLLGRLEVEGPIRNNILLIMKRKLGCVLS